MKRLLVTEEQLSSLVSHLSEAKLPPASDDKQKYRSMSEMGENLKDEFNQELRGMKPCDDIIIKFVQVEESEDDGDEIKGGVMIEGTEILIVLRALSVGDDGMTAKVVKKFGANSPLEKNTVYHINFKDVFNIEDDGVFLKFYLVGKKIDKKGGESDFTRPITIPDFQVYQVRDNKKDCKKEIADARSIALELDKAWFSGIDKLQQQTQYQPGLFGMNNIFFFPKGFKAMDDILAHFGMSIDKEDGIKKTVDFEILNMQNNTGTLKKGVKVKGIIDFNNNIRFGEKLIKVPEDVEIKNGEEIDADIYKSTKTSEYTLGPITIKINNVTEKYLSDIDNTEKSNDTEDNTEEKEKYDIN